MLEQHQKSEADLLCELRKDQKIIHHSKSGGFLATSVEYMIIVSAGDESPPGVAVEHKLRDEDRVQAAIKTHGILPHNILDVRLPEGAEVDVKAISSLIRDSSSGELVSLCLDLPGRQRSKHYYLQEIEKFLSNCKQGGEWLSVQCASTSIHPKIILEYVHACRKPCASTLNAQ